MATSAISTSLPRGKFLATTCIKGIGTLCNGKCTTSLQACKTSCILWIVAKYSTVVDVNAEDIEDTEIAEDIEVVKDIENAKIV